MIIRYFKQTVALLRQNKLFGTFYLLGTAVPVVLTMIVVMYFHLLTAPIYPENHRAQQYELRSISLTDAEGNRQGGGCCSEGMINQWFRPLRSVEAVTGIYYYDFGLKDNLQLGDGTTEQRVKTKYTDPGFFRVFDFQFLDGSPFTQADLDAARPCAVIASSLARQLFGTDKAKGRSFKMNDTEYTVTGVVRDASSLTPVSFAEIWLPYSCLPNYFAYSNAGITTGPYTVVFRTRDEAQAQQMQADIRELVRRHNASQPDGMQMELQGPLPSWKRNLVPGNQEIDLRGLIKFWGALLLTFLIVPAVNLGGMISGQMETRWSELGVSKAFGASRGYLMRQVIGENLILTFLGGLIGLLLSWALLGWGTDWVIGLFDTYGKMRNGTHDTLIRPDMLFSPLLFLVAFGFCLLLNLLSALIPAWHAMRIPIVQALGTKK